MSAPSTTSRSWLRVTGPADPRSTVVCIPHAGAGAMSFARWLAAFGPDVRVARVGLPGREDARDQQPLRRVHQAVDGLVPAVTDLPGSGPIALYGHSMGALVAYELARALSGAGTRPVHLVVSGRRAPNLAPRRPPIHRLPEPEFRSGVAAMSADPQRTATGIRYAAPVLRADLELGEEYVHAPSPILDVPMSAFGGAVDPLVTPDEIAAWAHVTSPWPPCRPTSPPAGSRTCGRPTARRRLAPRRDPRSGRHRLRAARVRGHPSDGAAGAARRLPRRGVLPLVGW